MLSLIINRLAHCLPEIFMSSRERVKKFHCEVLGKRKCSTPAIVPETLQVHLYEKFARNTRRKELNVMRHAGDHVTCCAWRCEKQN